MARDNGGRLVYRMETPCKDCPFSDSPEGTHLRKTLRRWGSILKEMRQARHFMCHKTTRETGDGSNLICAGSIEWQDKRGISSNYLRVCERLAGIAPRRKTPEKNP